MLDIMIPTWLFIILVVVGIPILILGIIAIAFILAMSRRSPWG